ncbi:unnamed protein product [Rhodiola kirilowii]
MSSVEEREEKELDLSSTEVVTKYKTAAEIVNNALQLVLSECKPSTERKDIPESSMRRVAAGKKMPRAERGQLLKELEIILEAQHEQRKRLNRLVRALRYPSDDEDEDEAADEDAGDSDEDSSS